MYSDNDIKIAGDRPSLDIKRNRETAASKKSEPKSEDIKNARELGRIIAEKFMTID